METSISITSNNELLCDHKPTPFLPVGSTWEMVGDLLQSLTTNDKDSKLSNELNNSISINNNNIKKESNNDSIHINIDLEDTNSNNSHNNNNNKPQNSNSTGIPILNENYMDIFGILPSEDPLVLIICTKCSKPIKQSRFTSHYETCKSIPSSHLLELNKQNSNGNNIQHNSTNNNEKKKSSAANGLVPLSRGRPKKKVDPPPLSSENNNSNNITTVIDQPKKVSQSLSSRKRSFDMRKNNSTLNNVNIDNKDTVNNNNSTDLYSGTEDEDEVSHNIGNNSNSNNNNNNNIENGNNDNENSQPQEKPIVMENLGKLGYSFWSIPDYVVPLATKKPIKNNKLKRIFISLDPNNNNTTTQHITFTNEEKDIRSPSDDEESSTSSNKNKCKSPVPLTSYLTPSFIYEHLTKAHNRIQNFQNYQKEFQQQQQQIQALQQQQLQALQQQQLQQQQLQNNSQQAGGVVLQANQINPVANAINVAMNTQQNGKTEQMNVTSPPSTPAVSSHNGHSSSTSASKKKSTKDKKSKREEKATQEESSLSPSQSGTTEKIKKKKSKREKEHVEKVKKPTKKSLRAQEQAAAAAAAASNQQLTSTSTALPIQIGTTVQPTIAPQTLVHPQNMVGTQNPTQNNNMMVQPGQLPTYAPIGPYGMPLGQLNMPQAIPMFQPNQPINTSTTFPVYNNPQIQAIPIQPQMPYAKPQIPQGYISPQQTPMTFTGTIGAPNNNGGSGQQQYQIYKQPAQMMPQNQNQILMQQQLQYQQNRGIYQQNQQLIPTPTNIRTSTGVASPQGGGVVPMMVNQWQQPAQNQSR